MKEWWLPELSYAGREHLDEAYVAGYERKAGFDPAEDLDVLDRLALGPDSTVVDLGAGAGTFALAVAPRCGTVIAVDVSPAMTATMRERIEQAGVGNITVVEAGFLSYDHRGDPADVVYTRNALHQLPDFWKGIALQRRGRRSSAPAASCACAISSSTSSPPRPTRGSRRGSRAPCPTQRSGGPRASWPNTCASSSAPTAGCSRRCSTGPASRSSTATTAAMPTAPTRAAGAEGRMRREKRETGVTIFDDLRASHEVQRSLARSITHGRASAENRRAAFLALANELDAHATAEERHFYVPLLMDDAGLSVTRHALADHHKAEELVEQLRGVDATTDKFAELAKQLATEVRDHWTKRSTGPFSSPGSCCRRPDYSSWRGSTGPSTPSAVARTRSWWKERAAQARPQLSLIMSLSSCFAGSSNVIT